jgi:hypothetical protein
MSAEIIPFSKHQNYPRGDRRCDAQRRRQSEEGLARLARLWPLLSPKQRALIIRLVGLLADVDTTASPGGEA